MHWKQAREWVRQANNAERRRYIRKAVFKTAIVFPVLEEAMLTVDNISQNGVSGTCPLTLYLHQSVHIRFGDQPFLAAEVRWVNGQRCGLLAEERLSLPGLPEATPEFATFDGREARIAAEMTATIVTSQPMMAAKVRNLSEGGMMIELGGPVAEGQLLLIRAKGQETIAARVQWVHNSMAGLAFQKAA